MLLARARTGDRKAAGLLVRRYLPALRRWAHGRLPVYARGLVDTDDLVQVALLRALGRVEHFEAKHAGAFPAYLRQILLNGIRDEIRKARRRLNPQGLDDGIPDPSPTPLERAIGSEVLGRYERGMARLPEDQRAAIVLRVELGLPYEEVGHLTGGRTANAARLMTARAIRRLAEEMDRG